MHHADFQEHGSPAMREPAVARGAVAGWVLKGLGNSLFAQVMIANYFPVWLVVVTGGSDGLLTLSNTVVMALMLFVGPWLGAVSDLLPRRMPVLAVTTLGASLLVFLLGHNLWLSLLLYGLANLLFQSSLIIYDALLPAVSNIDNRGRVNGLGVGLGYIGSLLGLLIGGVVLAQGGDYPTVFRITAIVAVLLALPCFFRVREQRRPTPPLMLLAVARGALADVAVTLAHARQRPLLVRFLIGRTLYAMAGGAIAIFMAVYLTVELGYSNGDKDRILLVAIVGAVTGGLLWGRVVDGIGARSALLTILGIWCLALAAFAATGLAWLPRDTLWLSGPVAGFALGGTWAADRPLMAALSPTAQLGQFFGLYGMAGRIAGLAGPLLWTLVAQGIGLGRPAALLTLLAMVVVAILVLFPIPDSLGQATG